MTTFSISPTVNHKITQKETKLLKRVTAYGVIEVNKATDDYNYVQLIYKDSTGLGLFRTSDYDNFVDSSLYWGIIGDEFNNLQ